jgi:hypothetical protein
VGTAKIALKTVSGATGGKFFQDDTWTFRISKRAGKWKLLNATWKIESTYPKSESEGRLTDETTSDLAKKSFSRAAAAR